jgi:hypothetical protein
MRARDTNRAGNAEADTDDAGVIALQALAWTLADQPRAERLLALTGLDADTLRARAGDPALLAAVLGFLASHEPDLTACADALGIAPERLVAAERSLAA